MKKILTICVMAVLALSFSACKNEETYIFSVSNGMHLQDQTTMGKIMTYAESKVKMGAESLWIVDGEKKAADESAINEFNKRLEAINETEFCAMMTTSEYYEFVLNRSANDSEGNSEVIVTKRYTGTKK